MPTKNEIEVIKPKPYERVGWEFILLGRIDKSCLKTSWGSTDYRVLGGFVDINGFEFASTINADVWPDIFSRFTGKLRFSAKAQFSELNIHFIKQSQGCIALKLSASKEGVEFFIPLIVEGFEPEGGIDTKIKARHGKIGELVKQYEQDLRDYHKEISKINTSRKAKDNYNNPKHLQGAGVSIAFDIYKILEDSEESFEEYLYSDEDKCERELEEKYKDALAWRGPLLKGVVSQFSGFDLTVYSDDHDSHFHVIHRGKGINARFSFPEIQLLNYKNSISTISSKQEKAIREHCQKTEIFDKFKIEFEKHPEI